MRKIILLISVTLLFISGCIETDQEVFLNMDGSGMVIMDTTYSPMFAMQYSMFGDPTTDSSEMVKKNVEQILSNNEILAWAGVESGPTSEGGFFFKGTAYFEDMDDISESGNAMFLDVLGSFELKQAADGTMVLEEEDYGFGEEYEDQDNTEKIELTDKQLEFKQKQLKMQLEQTKIMMGQYMGNFNYKMTIHLPGVIEEAKVFTVIDENTVMFKMEGKKIMEEFDKLLADESKLLEMVNVSEEMFMMGMMGMGGEDKFMRRIMLGTEEQMRVVIVPNTSMNVDYTNDIETAKSNFEEMVKKFGIEYVEPVEVQIDPNEVPEVVHVEVIGVELMYKSAIKENEPGLRNVQIYDYQEPGYKLHLFVDFSYPVSEIENIVIKSVVDDKGKELAEGSVYNSDADYFSADKRRVQFNIRLDLPSEGANSIKTLQGVIKCVSSSKLEKAELGFIELKEGAVSSEGDVKITYMYKDAGFDPENEDGEAGQIHFEIANHGYSIHDLELLDENGIRLKAYQPCGGGINSFDNKTRVIMEFGESIPDIAKIEVERTKHFAEYELPFEIENISLLGKAIKE